MALASSRRLVIGRRCVLCGFAGVPRGAWRRRKRGAHFPPRGWLSQITIVSRARPPPAHPTPATLLFRGWEKWVSPPPRQNRKPSIAGRPRRGERITLAAAPLGASAAARSDEQLFEWWGSSTGWSCGFECGCGCGFGFGFGFECGCARSSAPASDLSSELIDRATEWMPRFREGHCTCRAVPSAAANSLPASRPQNRLHNPSRKPAQSLAPSPRCDGNSLHDTLRIFYTVHLECETFGVTHALCGGTGNDCVTSSHAPSPRMMQFTQCTLGRLLHFRPLWAREELAVCRASHLSGLRKSI